MLGVVRCYRNLRRVIQRSDIDTDPIGPALERQGQLRPTPSAEMDIYIFTTALRRQRKDGRLIVGESEGGTFEDGLDHSVRPRGLLAEPTMADGYPKRITSRVVTDIAAKATAL